MKKNVYLLIFGLILVIVSILVKVSTNFEYSNYLLLAGLVIEVFSVIRILKELK